MPYPLTTARLSIAPLTAADSPALLAYRQDPEVARWQSWDPDYSAADAAALVAAQPVTDLPAAGGWLQLAVRHAATGVLLGDVAIHTLSGQADSYEIGVTLAAVAQHRGFGAEAVRRTLAYLFAEGEARRVVASCDARNTAVARLLQRVGMTRQSSQVGAEFCKGEWITLDSYAIAQTGAVLA